ncbi:MAG: hypothetical protein ACE5OO_07195, partial [Candidatus Bathyarchaeia archaeon]
MKSEGSKNPLIDILKLCSMEEESNADLGEEPASNEAGWVRALILLGFLLDLISTFLYWGEPRLYLPWSIPILEGYFLPRAGRYPLVSILMKGGTIGAWTGFIVYEFRPNRRRTAYMAVA